MSLKAKIIAGISVISALGAIVLLIIIMTGNNKTNDNLNNSENDKVNDLVSAVKKLPDQKSLDFICTELNGYWTSDNNFLAFVSSNDYWLIEYGLYQASYSISSEIKEANIAGENSFSLTIFIPATPPTEVDDAKPERTETIYIDVSNFHLDGRINAKIENLGDGEWHTYEYGGKSLTDAYSN